jgi:hypothetical protein
MTYYEYVKRNFEKYSGKSDYCPLNLVYLNSWKIQPKGDTMLKKELEALFLTTHLILTTVSASEKNID